MNQKEIESVEAFINEPITADNVDQPLVATFPQKEQCNNAINQYRCQLETGHAGICEDHRSASEIATSVGAEPAAGSTEREAMKVQDFILKWTSENKLSVVSQAPSIRDIMDALAGTDTDVPVETHEKYRCAARGGQLNTQCGNDAVFGHIYCTAHALSKLAGNAADATSRE